MITEADENAINDEGINEVVGNAVNDKDEDEHEHEAVNEVGEKGTSQDPIGDEVADIEDLGHNKNEVEHEAGEKETSQYSTEDEVPEIEDLGHSATEVEHEAGEKETSQDSADFLVNVEIASNLDDEVEYIRVNMRADRHESSTNVSEEDEDVAEVEGKLQDHESDYIESDDPGEYGESDDDSGDQICRAYMGRGKKQVGHKYDPKCAFPLWKLGLRFEDNKLFKEAVRKYAIAKGVALRFKKSEPKRVRAVVEGEGNESWKWFLTKLVQDLNHPDGEGLTLMSDQQKLGLPSEQVVTRVAKRKIGVFASQYNHASKGHGLKWRGKQVVTTRQLQQQQSDQHRQSKRRTSQNPLDTQSNQTDANTNN
ncbi:hypothetical protein V6N12_025308 [Hibiscus sabdariffa]|uniref:Transposase MuDR plant domain-containing protein n=1 Tax=Hibiscus sabdariffa TaxID=183260 RepID=A0ABR2CI52_9ROSI